MKHQSQRGQALVEFALILVLAVASVAGVIWATGPAMGTMYCNSLDQFGGNSETCMEGVEDGGPLTGGSVGDDSGGGGSDDEGGGGGGATATETEEPPTATATETEEPPTATATGTEEAATGTATATETQPPASATATGTATQTATAVSACSALTVGSPSLTYTASDNAEFRLQVTNSGSTTFTLTRVVMNWVSYGHRTDWMQFNGGTFWDGDSSEDFGPPTDSTDTSGDPGQIASGYRTLSGFSNATLIGRFRDNPSNLASQWSLADFNGTTLYFNPGGCTVTFSGGSAPTATATATATATLVPSATATSVSVCSALTVGSPSLTYTASDNAEFRLLVSNGSSTSFTLTRVVMNWVSYGHRTDWMQFNGGTFWDGDSSEDFDAPTDSTNTSGDPGQIASGYRTLSAFASATFIGRFRDNPSNLASQWGLWDFTGTTLYFSPGGCAITYSGGSAPTATPTVTPTATPVSGLPFSDNFNSGLGNWTITQGSGTYSSGGEMCTWTGGSNQRAETGNAGWTDYTIQINTATLNYGDQYHVFFRSQGTTPYNGYSFAFDQSYGTRGAFILYKWVNGVAQWPPEGGMQAPSGFNWSTSRSITIVVSGNSFSAYIDTVLVANGSDSSYSNGGMGLGAIGNSWACWDNLTVTEP